MESEQGKLVVLSGPSGAGKTSVVNALKAEPAIVFSVSATTRPMRKGEHAGVDYHFLSRKEFERRCDAGEFLEWAEYSGNLYGTLRAPMQEALNAGKIFVLEIEVEGTRQIRDSAIDGLFVFITPPSEAVLRQRLESRGQNSSEDIERRLEIARREMKAKDLYDHVVENHELDRAVADVKRLIGLE